MKNIISIEDTGNPDRPCLNWLSVGKFYSLPLNQVSKLSKNPTGGVYFIASNITQSSSTSINSKDLGILFIGEHENLSSIADLLNSVPRFLEKNNNAKWIWFLLEDDLRERERIVDSLQERTGKPDFVDILQLEQEVN